MNKPYLEKELDKIFTNSQFPFPLNGAMASILIMANFKGTNLKILDIGSLSPLADYFVLASAQNSMQADAMADEIAYQLKRLGMVTKSKEGSKESDWILLDTGNLIVHIFLENSRKLYDLDELWNKAPTVSIPQALYFEISEEQAGLLNKMGQEKTLDQYY